MYELRLLLLFSHRRREGFLRVEKPAEGRRLTSRRHLQRRKLYRLFSTPPEAAKSEISTLSKQQLYTIHRDTLTCSLCWGQYVIS